MDGLATLPVDGVSGQGSAEKYKHLRRNGQTAVPASQWQCTGIFRTAQAPQRLTKIVLTTNRKESSTVTAFLEILTNEVDVGLR
jgi:hypothetical protein